MHIAVGLLSLALLALMLAEFFVTFLLPRRVRHDPRIARALLRSMWKPWRAIAARLPRVTADTVLGIFGPFGLIAILVVLSAGVIVGFCGLLWASSAHLHGSSRAPVGQDAYFSAGTFFSTTTAGAPKSGLDKTMQIVEAATGFGFLAIAIGYLPALFQAFSRREIAVSRLDPRAGSPPSAGGLLQRSGQRGGWPELDGYLCEWETWTAELMETHLSYPIIGYFRSQHVNQNWLAALTTVVDACAYAMAYGPQEAVRAAELTFKIGRHALADLTHAYGSSPTSLDRTLARARLTDDHLADLRRRLDGSRLHAEQRDTARQTLAQLRDSYEPFAVALSSQLALDLPTWLPDDVRENWRTAQRHDPEGALA